MSKKYPAASLDLKKMKNSAASIAISLCMVLAFNNEVFKWSFLAF